MSGVVYEEHIWRGETSKRNQRSLSITESHVSIFAFSFWVVIMKLFFTCQRFPPARRSHGRRLPAPLYEAFTHSEDQAVPAEDPPRHWPTGELDWSCRLRRDHVQVFSVTFKPDSDRTGFTALILSCYCTSCVPAAVHLIKPPLVLLVRGMCTPLLTLASSLGKPVLSAGR